MTVVRCGSTFTSKERNVRETLTRVCILYSLELDLHDDRDYFLMMKVRDWLTIKSNVTSYNEMTD